MKSLGKISAQAPYETSLGKMSLYKISRFVRACAVEMHMDMSSKPFGSRIYRKCRAPEVCRTFCCEPAHSKCTWTCHKSDFTQKNYRKNAAQNRDTRLCEPAQSKCSWTCHKSQILCRNLQGKCRTLIPGHGAPVLCEPAQSKCTWTCHKSHLVQKLIRKMPKAPETTSNEHWARTLTVRTPSVATLFGEK